ncbi:MAG: XdhC/CoxI family protein [Candidatus Sumerlaeaceae bacterium]|nr:XdhC/CoxI family protein [Candidatus Sumerlaeaceae bacterium]
MSFLVMQAAYELLRAGKRGAIVTIIETVGSTPRKAGAKMLVAEDGQVTGTIGGGCVEADLFAFAREVIRNGQVMTREVDLTARKPEENDMLCGGRLKVLIEPLVASEKLFIFGGGHISKALHEVCSRLDFQVIVTDDRPEFANAERFPHAAKTIALPFEKQFDQLEIDGNSSIVIVTRGHSHDELCMEQAIQSPARYIAMVGSRTKVAVFRKNLRERGFTEEQMARVKCPAGLDIAAETPEEIAISIAAQLIEARRKPASKIG